MKRYFLVECEFFESADDLRDSILDALGYPLRIEGEPDLLKVSEIDPPLPS